VKAPPDGLAVLVHHRQQVGPRIRGDRELVEVAGGADKLTVESSSTGTQILLSFSA
jgi:hypothetical protein